MEINFNGFSTRVLIENKKVSATNISLSTQENIIQFEGAYGGEMNLSGSNYFMMNAPSFYELPEISCSIDTEITHEQINNLFFNWLEDRGKARSVLISNGKISNKTFNFSNCCYFKSLKLEASQNSLVSASYDFYVLSDKLFSESLKNDVPKLQSEIVFDMSSKDNKPIGFWETKIDGFEKNRQVIDWNLTFNQNIIPKYYCGRIDDNEVIKPPLPDIMIGYPKMELSVNFLMDKQEFDKEIFSNFSDNKKTVYPHETEDEKNSSENQLSLYIRDKEICRFLYGKVISYSPAFSGNHAITFNVNYLIHKIFLVNSDDR